MWLTHADPTHWHQISSRVVVTVRFPDSLTLYPSIEAPPQLREPGLREPKRREPAATKGSPLPASHKPPWRPQGERQQSAATPSLSLLASWTVAKQVDSPTTNEDAAVWIPERHQAAVLDGATESYAAQRWVSIIVNQMQASGRIDLASAQDEYAASMSSEALSWMQAEAAQRGSFTTLATVQPTHGGLRARLVGDSAIILLSSGSVLRAYPFSDAESFSSAPEALASAPDLLDSTQRLLDECTWDIALTSAVDTVMLVTDAIAAWLLVNDKALRRSRVQQVLGCRTDMDWADLVIRERIRAEMKTDDSTAIILEVGGMS